MVNSSSAKAKRGAMGARPHHGYGRAHRGHCAPAGRSPSSRVAVFVAGTRSGCRPLRRRGRQGVPALDQKRPRGPRAGSQCDSRFGRSDGRDRRRRAEPRPLPALWDARDLTRARGDADADLARPRRGSARGVRHDRPQRRARVVRTSAVAHFRRGRAQGSTRNRTHFKQREEEAWK